MRIKLGKINYAVTKSRLLAAATGMVAIAGSVNSWVSDHPEFHINQRYTFLLALIPIVCRSLIPEVGQNHPKDLVEPTPGTGAAQDAVNKLTPKGL